MPCSGGKNGSTISGRWCHTPRVSDRARSPGDGWVVSDLHLFARRSEGELLMEALLPQLRGARLLVLNGDIVDFRWSTLSGHAETGRCARAWLGRLLASLPDCEVHYVLGNHDCLFGYSEELESLGRECGRFHWHRLTLRLGHTLFLHGDCTQRRMSLADMEAYRDAWSRADRRGRAASSAYRMADHLGLTRLVHRCHFPRGRTLRRLTHHLDDALVNWRANIRHCYFGHTHEPFSDFLHEGVTYHNTGSAIHGMEFRPLRFAVYGSDVGRFNGEGNS
ncbi:MAG TPA: hypothetical protein DCY13_24100 [Verrucomicrobiales bacterium]|nr:hypothetical protein [Verrucomicrobiales bacterium]